MIAANGIKMDDAIADAKKVLIAITDQMVEPPEGTKKFMHLKSEVIIEITPAELTALSTLYLHGLEAMNLLEECLKEQDDSYAKEAENILKDVFGSATKPSPKRSEDDGLGINRN